MEELIRIEKGRDGESTVSARELHAFLESKRDFSTWIKDRVERYGFVENQDFAVFTKIGENPCGGRPMTEYAISLDMAKELSMVENNEKGRQARRYFIECEKKMNGVLPVVRDPQKAALIQALVQLDALEREQERARLELDRQSRELSHIREEVAVIEARTQPENRHYTVMGWARLNNMPLPVDRAAHIGRRCANLSRQRGLPIGDVKDPRFGKVHSYHDSVLRDVFPGPMCN